jgi:hypothetical protein
MVAVIAVHISRQNIERTNEIDSGNSTICEQIIAETTDEVIRQQVL